MTRRYKTRIKEERKLNKTKVVVFDQFTLNRIEEYIRINELEDYSFSSSVRELIEFALDQLDKRKTESKNEKIDLLKEDKIPYEDKNRKIGELEDVIIKKVKQLTEINNKFENNNIKNIYQNVKNDESV